MITKAIAHQPPIANEERDSVRRQRGADAFVLAILFRRALSHARHFPAARAPPAGQYQIDKSHASLSLRVSHMGFSTYTTRLSRSMRR